MNEKCFLISGGKHFLPLNKRIGVKKAIFLHLFFVLNKTGLLIHRQTQKPLTLTKLFYFHFIFLCYAQEINVVLFYIYYG